MNNGDSSSKEAGTIRWETEEAVWNEFVEILLSPAKPGWQKKFTTTMSQAADHIQDFKRQSICYIVQRLLFYSYILTKETF